MKIIKWSLGIIAAISILIGGITIKSGCDAFMLKENEAKIFPELKNHTLHNMGDLGQYYSGATVMLFTLATVLFIILAYINQREEIKHLKEMNDKQDKMINAQIDKDDFEKFERTFYRLLDWHTSFMNSISAPFMKDKKTVQLYTGRGAINQVLLKFIGNIKINTRGKDKPIKEAIDISFYILFKGYDDMKPYFNNLYSVIDFVDTYFLAEVIEENELEKFMAIIAGQLSSSEVEFLCYYGLYSKAPTNLKLMIENNSLLRSAKGENINSEVLPLYDKRAFGS